MPKGTNIGHKRIAVFPAVYTRKLRLIVEDSKATPHISRFAAFAAE